MAPAPQVSVPEFRAPRGRYRFGRQEQLQKVAQPRGLLPGGAEGDEVRAARDLLRTHDRSIDRSINRSINRSIIRRATGHGENVYVRYHYT